MTTRQMELRKGLLTGLLMAGLFTVLFLCLAITGQAAGKKGTVKNRVLNVRQEASTSSSIVCKLSQGNTVTIESEKTGTDGMTWYKITCTSGGKSVKGYVRGDLVTVSGTSATGSTGSSGSSTTTFGDTEVLYVKASSVNVREDASTTSAKVAGLIKGTQVKQKKTVTGSDGKAWTKVSFTYNGTKTYGYIRSDLLTAEGSGSSQSGTSAPAQSTSTKDGDILAVNVEAVRVRKHASDSSEIVANLMKGDKVKQKSTKTGSDGKQWTKVSFDINGTKYHGYIRSDFLTYSGSSQSSSQSSGNNEDSEYRYVSATAVRVREKPSDDATIVANLLKGDRVEFRKERIGDDGKKWTKVAFTLNGTRYHGYIRSDLLSTTK